MQQLIGHFEKLQKSFDVLQDSVSRLQPLTPAIMSSSLLMEPYDALASRFERFVEIALNKFFRSIEFHLFSKSSDSMRDRLLVMQKFGLVTSVDLWMEMRDFRNRIAHDYLPEQLSTIFNGIRDRFYPEAEYCIKKSNEFVSTSRSLNNV